VDILQAIGNTSMVQLRKVVTSSGCADVLVKLEWENPTGSMKDRMAQAVISRPEQDGRLHPGDTIVEYTGGLTTKKLILDMIETARRLSQQPHTYWTDQLNNHDSIAGYRALGEEIWDQTSGSVDAFVHGAGTAASSRGVATVLKRKKSGVRIAVVEPAESAVLSGGAPGPHKIEGVGIGYTPPLWDPSLVDEILAVPTDDAKEMTRRLAREEGLFAGTSSGANVIAAIRMGERFGPDATVVTLMADSGLKYLNTDVYRS